MMLNNFVIIKLNDHGIINLHIDKEYNYILVGPTVRCVRFALCEAVQ